MRALTVSPRPASLAKRSQLPGAFRRWAVTVLRELAGPAPIPLRSGVFSPLLVCALLSIYALLLATIGVNAIGWIRLPTFVAAVVLSAPAALAVGATAVSLTYSLLIPAVDRAMVAPGGHADPIFYIVSAIVLRAIVVAGVTSRTDHFERESVLADRLDAVLGVTERLATTHDRQALLHRIADEAARALHADATVLRILRDDRLEVAAWSGLDDATAAALPVFGPSEGWFGEIVRTGKPWVVEDARVESMGGVYARYEGIYEFRGDIIVPLIRDDSVIGSLSVVTIEPRHWTDGDVAFVTALGTHASIALRNAELLARTEVRAAQLGVLQAASARLSRASGVEAVGRAIVEETRRIIDYHNARVYVIEPDGWVVPVAFAGTVGAYEQVDFEVLRCRLGEGFTGWVAQHGEPLLVADANLDPRGATIPGTDEVEESMLVVPMTYDATVVGVITLSKLGLHQFDEDDERLLLILADQAATALESARLLTRSHDLAGELRRLLDMSSQLSASLDPRQVANLIARHLALAMGFEECAISTWDRTNQRVVTMGYFPEDLEADLEPSYEIAGFPQTLRVLQEQVSLAVDANDPAADRAELELMHKAGNRSLIMLPLVAKGQSVGLVELISKSAISLDEERLQLARTMANEAAMALENARLYEEARALADHDPLTGYFNHRYLHERLGEEVVRAQRSRQPLSVLMLDLDDFKLVNDTFGHLFGDRVLTWTAEVIRSTLRVSDIAARYGGDEFAIILPDTGSADAEHTAGRIRQAFATTAYEGGNRGPVPIALAIGAATFPADGRSATELIAVADAALYREKRAAQGGEPARTRTPHSRRSSGDHALSA